MNVFLSDHEVLEELAAFFKKSRVNLQMTQEDIVEKTGLGRGVISRFENDSNISLSNFITLLRAVNKLDGLLDFARQERSNPKIYKEKEVQRVRKKKNESGKGFFME